MKSKSSLTMLAGALLATFSAYALQFAVESDNEFKAKTPTQINDMFARGCARAQARLEGNTESANAKPDMQSDFMKACVQERVQWKQQAILGAKVATSFMALMGLYISVLGWRSRSQKPATPDGP